MFYIRDYTTEDLQQPFPPYVRNPLALSNSWLYGGAVLLSALNIPARRLFVSLIFATAPFLSPSLFAFCISLFRRVRVFASLSRSISQLSKQVGEVTKDAYVLSVSAIGHII